MGSQQSGRPEPERAGPAPLWQPGPGAARAVPGAARPRAGTAAFWLGVLDVVVAGALLAAKCVMSDDLVLRAMGNADFLLTESDVQEVYYGILSGVVLLAGVAALVWFGLLVAMRRGRPWARAALIALGFGWAVYSLLSLVGRHPDGMVFPLLELAQVLSLAATLAALHAAREHFTA